MSRSIIWRMHACDINVCGTCLISEKPKVYTLEIYPGTIDMSIIYKELVSINVQVESI